MKKIFSAIVLMFISISLFAQLEQRRLGTAVELQPAEQKDVTWDSNVPKECFCCDNRVYNLPKPPPINYTPSGHPSFPSAICPCNTNTFSTMKCEGATFSWAVNSNTGPLSFTGNGTPQITLQFPPNGPALWAITSVVVTVEIKCGQKTVTNTIKVPVLQGGGNANVNLSVNFPSGGPGSFTATNMPSAALFGNGWTLRAFNLPYSVPCDTWDGSTPIIANGIGNSFSFGGLTTGKFYRIVHYVNLCSPTWVAGSCVRWKHTCFVIMNAAAKMAKPEELSVFKSKNLEGGNVLFYAETDPSDGASEAKILQDIKMIRGEGKN
jgi:hypothetical protein